MRTREEETKNIYTHPGYCNDGMCKHKAAIVMIETQKPSGKNQITPFSLVCVKSPVGNITNQLNSDYTFIRWHTWCGDCFIDLQEKQRL